MKRILLIVILLMTFWGFFGWWELTYPSEWDKVRPGMTRQEVTELIGPGAGEFSGWKGPFWQSRKIFVWYEMEIHFGAENKVEIIRIQRYFGEHSQL